MPLKTGLEDLVEKTATVPTGMKMYRRALTGLRKALPNAKDPGVVTKGFALHGTEALPDVLSQGQLLPSQLGNDGQHGAGVYWWRGHPNNDGRYQYLMHPTHEGVLTDLESLKKLKMKANIESGVHTKHMALSGPGEYRLRPKDYAVIDHQRRKSEGALPGMLADAADAHTRVLDSRIFNQALRDHKAVNTYNSGGRGELPPQRTSGELRKLLRG